MSTRGHFCIGALIIGAVICLPFGITWPASVAAIVLFVAALGGNHHG